MRLPFVQFGLALCVMFALGGCEGENASEYYGDLLSSPSGLVLEQSEHELGWQRSDCYSCHATENFHIPRPERRDTFDMEAVQELVEADGLASCAACHGNNGVALP